MALAWAFALTVSLALAVALALALAVALRLAFSPKPKSFTTFAKEHHSYFWICLEVSMSVSPRALEDASTQLPPALHELLNLLPADEQQALRKVWTLHRTVVNTQQQLQTQQEHQNIHELVPPLNAFNGLIAQSKIAQLLPQVFTGYSYVGLQTIIGGLSLDTSFRPADIYTQQMQSMPPEAMLLSPNSCLRSILFLGTSGARADFNRQLIATFPEDTNYIAAVTLLQAPVAFAPGVTPGAVAPKKAAASAIDTNTPSTQGTRSSSNYKGYAEASTSTEVSTDDPNLYFIPTIFVLTSEGYFVTTVTLEAMPHPYLRFEEQSTDPTLAPEANRQILELEEQLDASVFLALEELGIKRQHVEICPSYELTIPPNHQELFSIQLHKLAHTGVDFTAAIPSDFALSWVMQPTLLAQLLRAGTASYFDPNYLTAAWPLPLRASSVPDNENESPVDVSATAVAPLPDFTAPPSAELQRVWSRLGSYEQEYKLGELFNAKGQSVLKDIFNLNLILDTPAKTQAKGNTLYWLYMSLPQENYAHEVERIRADVEHCLAGESYFRMSEAQRNLRKTFISPQYTVDELALQRHVLQKLGTIEVTNVQRPIEKWQEVKGTIRHLMAKMRVYLNTSNNWQPQVRPFTLTRFYDGKSRRAGMEIDGRSLLCQLYPDYFAFEDFTYSFDLPEQQRCYAEAQLDSWKTLYSGCLSLQSPTGHNIYLNEGLMHGAIFVLGLVLAEQHHVQQRLKDLIATVNHATHGLNTLIVSEQFTSCPYALHQELIELLMMLKKLQQRHNHLIAMTHCNIPYVPDFLALLDSAESHEELRANPEHTQLCLWTLGLLGLNISSLTQKAKPQKQNNTAANAPTLPATTAAPANPATPA